MTTLGIIGSGNIGTAVARLAVAAGVPVVLSNSRGPHSLVGLTAELGPLSRAGTVEQAAQAADLVLLSVPLSAHTAVPAAPLAGKTVLDTSNYYPSRDGRVAELDDHKLTTSELVHRHFDGARLVKAFSNILAHHIPQLALPAESPGAKRTALPIAGNDAGANVQAATLINRLGFDTVDTGPLTHSWRFEPDATAYIRLYLGDPSTSDEQIFTAPGRPVPAAELRAALQAAERVRVADRIV